MLPSICLPPLFVELFVRHLVARAQPGGRGRDVLIGVLLPHFGRTRQVVVAVFHVLDLLEGEVDLELEGIVFPLIARLSRRIFQKLLGFGDQFVAILPACRESQPVALQIDLFPGELVALEGREGGDAEAFQGGEVARLAEGEARLLVEIRGALGLAGRGDFLRHGVALLGQGGAVPGADAGRARGLELAGVAPAGVPGGGIFLVPLKDPQGGVLVAEAVAESGEEFVALPGGEAGGKAVAAGFLSRTRK